MILDWLRKSQSWFTRAVLILLAITFIFGFGFGLVDFVGSGANVPQGTAAEVNGEKIAVVDFYRARDNLYRQYGQQGEVPSGISSFVDRIALEQLVDSKLLAQKAANLGLSVTDGELSEAIKSIPALQVSGQFIGADAYKAFVRQAFGEGVGEFEEKYREELLAAKLVNLIYGTARVTDEELLNRYRMQNEKVSLNFVSFSPDNFKGSYSPGEKDVKKYYEEHKSEFKTPELRSIEYVILGPEKFETKANVSEEEINAYYEANTDDFRTEGKVRPLSDVKDEIRAIIKEQQGISIRDEYAQSLAERLKKDPLNGIAEENGIARVNESLAFSLAETPDEIPSQVAQKAFSMKKGEKSLLQVEDQIWVMEVTGAVLPKQKKTGEAAGEITEKLKAMKAKETAKSKAEEVLKKVKAGNASLEEAAKPLGLKQEETGYFSRLENVPRINSDELKVDAFYLDDQNPVASKVYSDGDKFYVVSFTKKQEIDPEEFQEKKTELKESELSQRRRSLYADWIQELRQKSEININENLFSPQA